MDTSPLSHQKLNPARTGLLIVDMQSKLMPLLAQAEVTLSRTQMMIQAARELNLPIVLTEQYPEGLGETLPAIRNALPEDQEALTKTTFSALGDQRIAQRLEQSPIDHWLIVGIEAHICILQTAKDLQAAGKGVVILNDAVTAGSIYELSAGLSEMRDCGIRISCTETILFELVQDSKSPHFQTISRLIKEGRTQEAVGV